MKKDFNVVDMFCGAGGESTGIMLAALQQNMNVRMTAINHWERAIETHAANHPSAEHLCQSVEHIDPTKAVPGQRLDLLWASPECTHHSIARGGRPRSDQSRASAWLILKWLSELYVERVIIENVPEFLSWGPLDDTGRPIQNQKGKTFRAFISSLRSLGYSVDWKILTAADYGDPTTRRRLFIQAVKGRKRILWPQITHMDGTENLMGYQPWRPARDIIDWSIPGTSIFDRKKPLADATIRRIAAGIEKYWKDYAKPFLAVLYGTSTARSLDLPVPAISCVAHHALIEPVPLLLGQQSGAAARPASQPVPTVATAGAISVIQPFLTNIGQSSAKDRSRSIDEPLTTIVTKAEHCLIEPFITRYQGSHEGEADGDTRNHSATRPLPTVDTSNRYGLVEPLLVEYYGNGGVMPLTEPIPTLTTKDHFALMTPFMLKVNHRGGDRLSPVDTPMGTLTTKGSDGLVEGFVGKARLDIRFRMLKPHELARAQGFPEEYKILGTAAEQTKQIGNAVPVNTAKALAKAVMSA
jgi:DNA (cytosine-5)-methyltransferase 1